MESKTLISCSVENKIYAEIRSYKDDEKKRIRYQVIKQGELIKDTGSKRVAARIFRTATQLNLF